MVRDKGIPNLLFHQIDPYLLKGILWVMFNNIVNMVVGDIDKGNIQVVIVNIDINLTDVPWG